MTKATTTLTMVLALLAAETFGRADEKPALARYVQKPDPHCRWEMRRAHPLGDGVCVELTLISQKWRGTLWKHALFLIKPASTRDDETHALLFLGGGDWEADAADPDFDGPLPHEVDMLAAVAESLGTPVAVLLNVPHQPLDGRRGDALLAASFQEFLAGGAKDPEQVALLPMVKSAAQAMDATQKYAQSEWSLHIQRFTVTGGSKRGWTAWLAAAVDPRVTALAPMAIDLLNLKSHLQLQLEAWGKPSAQLHDYTARDLHSRLNSKEGEALLTIIDPYRYRDRLTQPKLIMRGTNDDYWPLESLNLYLPELPEDKRVLYLPNSRHARRDLPRILGGLNALHQHARADWKLPTVCGSAEVQDETIELEIRCSRPPQEVRVWIAESPTRDFRQAVWAAKPAKPDAGVHIGIQSRRPDCFTAIFGEARFDAPGLPCYLSTTITVVPPRERP